MIGSRRESRQIPLSCDLVKQDLSDDEVFHPAGVILGGRAGATMPLTDFGYALSEGAKKAVGEQGLLRAFTGGITATAGGIAAAILFGYLFALFARPKTKM